MGLYSFGERESSFHENDISCYKKAVSSYVIDFISFLSIWQTKKIQGLARVSNLIRSCLRVDT